MLGLARSDASASAVKAAGADDGTNRWSAVHRLDAAKLFRLAIEKAPSGARLHAAAEESIPSRQIAEAIG